MDVELDVSRHKNPGQKEYDRERTQLLNEFGIKVSRFWNHQVIDEIEKVLENIAGYLE